MAKKSISFVRGRSRSQICEGNYVGKGRNPEQKKSVEFHFLFSESLSPNQHTTNNKRSHFPTETTHEMHKTRTLDTCAIELVDVNLKGDQKYSKAFE